MERLPRTGNICKLISLEQNSKSHRRGVDYGSTEVEKHLSIGGLLREKTFFGSEGPPIAVVTYFRAFFLCHFRTDNDVKSPTFSLKESTPFIQILFLASLVHSSRAPFLIVFYSFEKAV